MKEEQHAEGRHQDRHRNHVLSVACERRAEQQGRNHQGGLLHPGDPALRRAKLHEHAECEDDAEESAVAELRHRPRHTLEGREPPDDERREPEEAEPEHHDENAGRRRERA
jgi:hypothetical protein